MRFKVGDIVYNETFGLGKVLGITEYGKDNYLNIRFHTPRQSGIQSIRENDNSVFSTILYEAVKEIKNRDNVTVSDIREFIRQRFNNALINKTCAISDDIRTFCEEFSLNESFVIDCIKKNNQENLSKKIKLELKEGYISLKDLENLYEDNKLIIDYASLENLVKQHNLEFMKNELQKYPDVFQIEGFVLDDEQKQAVVSDEINALVVAGAGCGKTSMLISKVAYLLQKGVSQEEILLISYTNKTVDDLRERLAKFTSIEPMTIHSFCKNVILNERKRCDKQLLYKVIESIKSGKSNFLKDFYRVILEYLGLYSDIGSDFNKFATSFNAKKTCAQYENDKKYDTLASIIKNFEQKNTTVKGDKVKSLAEAQIANFLFLNNIKYEYELEYTKEYYGKTNDASKSYHPDFHIHTPKGDVWLEHFGVTDENGKIEAKWCKDEKRYIEQMYEKIETHKQNKTILIQTNQTMYKQGILLEYIKKELIKYGVVFNPLSDEQVEKYIIALKNKQKYHAFETFLERFINLLKSQEKFTLDDLEQFLYKRYANYSLRTESFFKIVKPIYNEYEKLLKKNNLIDFSDMIMNAIKKLRNGEYVSNYKYIIVDEFQDINQNTYELLHLLQETSGVKLFCVGDDWQSIYGFSGSDVSLFQSFDSLFPYANSPYDNSKFRLKNTHRNSQELLNITKDFIEKNNKQIPKELKADPHHHNSHPIKVAHFYKNKKTLKEIAGCVDASDALEIIIQDICVQDKEHLTLTVLGRYNDDVYTIFGNKNTFTIHEEIADMPRTIEYHKNTDFKINFMTIHKAKGLEFDNVAVFLQEGNNVLSFPSGYTNDYLIQHLLHEAGDSFPNAEERRIFYVALTRCINQCYIINSEDNPSSFYQEIKTHTYSLNDTLAEYCKKIGKDICPACGSGIYEEHTNNTNGNKFWACDNQNCDVATKVKGIKKCHQCGSLLVERSNNIGNKFLGCTNYPSCHYTESLDINPEKQ